LSVTWIFPAASIVAVTVPENRVSSMYVNSSPTWAEVEEIVKDPETAAPSCFRPSP
jgi:hypothetical protein